MKKQGSRFSVSAKTFIFVLVFMVGSSFAETQAPLRRAKRRVRKEVAIRYTEEKIDGHLFTHRVDVANGDRKERWAIDGKAVSEDEYEQSLLDAERAEIQRERRRVEELKRKEELDLAQQQEFTQRSTLMIERKRLELLLAQVESELSKVKISKLVPYYAFAENSFKDLATFNHFCDELIPQAHELCGAEVIQVDEVHKVATRLEEEPSRLKAFFRDTVNNAINKCDDTRFLKELLETV
jgi:hypothetical protein